MVKKEFTKGVQKGLNNLSDIELIEELDGSTYGSGEVYREIIRAILDKRLKTSIHDLKKVTQKSNEKTEKYNKLLFKLTIVIAILSFLMLIGLGIQIWLLLK